MIADKQLEVDFVQTVLGLGEESAGRLNAATAQENITKECFTDPFLWEVYKAAKEVARRGEQLDVPTVAAILGADSRDKLATLWPVIPRMGGLRVISARLKEYAARRAASDIGRRIIEAANDTSQPHGESLVKAAAALQASYSADGTGIVEGTQVLLDFYEELERAQTGQYGVHLIPTGIAPMDDVVGGLPRKFLSIIGAYPGCFKSGIMATIAANIAARGVKVGFFSLEDNPAWVAKRFVSRATGIPVEDLTRRRLNSYELESVGIGQDRVAQVMGNIIFDGRSNLTGADVAASARFMIAEKGAEVVIVDHIGEMQTQQTDKRKDRPDLEVSANVRWLRDVAKETGIAVMMAAHLRRKQDSEEDIYRVPTMTDFSDSSGIEKMCRLAFGLFQPKDSPGQVCLKVLKQNEGGARGKTFYLTKDERAAMVKNT